VWQLPQGRDAKKNPDDEILDLESVAAEPNDPEARADLAETAEADQPERPAAGGPENPPGADAPAAAPPAGETEPAPAKSAP
jgi:hypothetical protein